MPLDDAGDLHERLMLGIQLDNFIGSDIRFCHCDSSSAVRLLASLLFAVTSSFGLHSYQRAGEKPPFSFE